MKSMRGARRRAEGQRVTARVHLSPVFLGLALLLSPLAACGPDGGAGGGNVGTARYALELPNSGVIDRVDYTVRITFLETDPPTPTLEENYSSVAFGGELITVLPCTTGADGDGLNQVDITAKIWVKGDETPFDAKASAVYTCVRNADTLVNVVLNVIDQLDRGFVDLDLMVGGTLCSSKLDWKADGYLGVCPQATCGRGEEVLLFANECEAVQADTPTYWTCGDPADWQIVGKRANAFFQVPEGSGTWKFGVIALDVFQMRQPDPTLTAADGTVKIWAGLSAVRAELVRQGRETVRKENGPYIYDFAAELALAPREIGQPSPELLMLVKNDELGARVTWQRRYGACDVPTAGVTLYPGLIAIDVRRDGNQAAKITFANLGSGFATSSARCETGWDAVTDQAKPIITCGAPSPLL